MRHAAIVLMLAAACTAGGPGGTIGVARTQNVVTYAPAQRAAAPPVAGEMLVGMPVSLDGSVAVVNFWGSWCGPCRAEQPNLEALWKRFGPDGVVFIGVNTRRDQRAAALAFLREFDVTYPSIYDPASSIADAFGVRNMPATFVLDRDGRIAAQVIGAVTSESDLVGLLARELAA